MNTLNSSEHPPRFRFWCVVLALLLLGLVLPASMQLAKPHSLVAQGYQPGDEIVELRGKYHKIWWLGGNKYQFVGRTGSEHYKNNPDDPIESWKEIDETIIPSSHTNWDWEVTRGHWKLLIRKDTSIAMGRHGMWLGFRLDGIAYLDWQTKEYVILQKRQDIIPTASNNTIRWEGVFNGVNLEYRYTSDKFRENIEVTQTARNWLKNNPPSNYGLNNQSSLLVFYSKCDWRNIYPAKDKNGVPINWDYDNEFSESQVDFWHPIKNYIVATLTPSWARAPPHDPLAETVLIHKRFFRQDNQHWLLFGSFVTKLNQLPEGTIVFDPDTFYPDADPETSSVDSYVQHNLGPGNGISWSAIVAAGGLSADDDNTESFGMRFLADQTGRTDLWIVNGRGILLFDTSNLPDDANIISANISLYGSQKADPTSNAPTVNIYSSNPASNTAVVAGDYDSLGEAAYCDTAIAYADWSTTGYNEFSLNAIGIAAINVTGVSRFGTRCANYDYTGASAPSWTANAQTLMWYYTAEQSGTSQDPKLVVTYVVLPTLDTLATSNITHNSATLTGNITATGGEDNDQRGFVWDSTSRSDPGNTAPASSNYTDNWTEHGSFGTGTFTHTISGLSPGTTYYNRAFGHNQAGWAYGGEVSFTTDVIAPTVVTSNATSVTATGATLNAEITATGGENADTRGFEWGIETGNYTDNWTEAGSFGVAIFSHATANLSANSTYYYRGMAHNSEGWGYGSEVDFTTSSNVTVLGPPLNLAATYIDDFQIDLTWIKDANANNTLIKAKYDSYPENTDDGETVYFGDASSCSDTLVDLSLRTGDRYYTAWSENENLSYSDDYAQTYIGGVGLGIITQLLGVMLLLGLAFWRRETFLYIIIGIAPVAFGFGVWYDEFQTPFGLIFAITLAGVGMFAWFLAIENIIDWMKVRRR